MFDLLYTRLACLCLLNFTALAAEESRLLEDTAGAFYRSSSENSGGGGGNILPWELRVLCARLAGLAYGDTRRGIAAFYELAREARVEAKSARTGTGRKEWESRLQDLGLGVASVLVEGGDLEGAARHLEGLRRDDGDGGIIEGRLALCYLGLGDVDAARRCLDSTSSSPSAEMMQPLLAIAEGRYAEAITALRALPMPHSDLVTQNLAICLFYIGKVDETVQLLEGLLGEGRAFHALTFNLATCFELTSEAAAKRKGELAGRVVGGIRERGSEAERGSGDFKL